jgi:hypothetical protein
MSCSIALLIDRCSKQASSLQIEVGARAGFQIDKLGSIGRLCCLLEGNKVTNNDPMAKWRFHWLSASARMMGKCFCYRAD